MYSAVEIPWNGMKSSCSLAWSPVSTTEYWEWDIWHCTAEISSMPTSMALAGQSVTGGLRAVRGSFPESVSALRGTSSQILPCLCCYPTLPKGHLTCVRNPMKVKKAVEFNSTAFWLPA